MLPLNGDCEGIPTVEFDENTPPINDKGPASDQTDPGDDNYTTHSSVLLPDPPINIQKEVQNTVNDVLGDNSNAEGVTFDKRGTCTIPWPTRDNLPMSEYTTVNFFTLALFSLFPYVSGDFFPQQVYNMFFLF